MTPALARVAVLQRFPVKSLTGERVERLDLDRRGVVGDRRWSVRTAAGKIGSGKKSRRFDAVPGLLLLRSETRPDGVWIRFPDGTACAVTDPAAAVRVSEHVGVPVTLAEETDVSHFDDGPVSLLAQASVDAIGAAVGGPLDPVRFRANLLLDGLPAFADEQWVERELAVGTATLRVDLASPRCVMVDMETADLPEQHGVLRTLGRENKAQLGIVASVLTPGVVRVGDTVTVV